MKKMDINKGSLQTQIMGDPQNIVKNINLTTEQTLIILRQKIKEYSNNPNNIIKQNFVVKLWEIYTTDLPGAAVSLKIIKEGAKHYYLEDIKKVIMDVEPTTFEKLKGESLVIVLAEILKYIKKGRVLGPLDGNCRYLWKDKLIFSPLFTIPKADSTPENPKARVIMNGSVNLNENMDLKSACMLKTKDLIYWANHVFFCIDCGL